MPSPAPARRTSPLDGGWAYLLFGVVVAVLTWDVLPITPTAGVDPSWMLALSLTAAEGLDHGTEVVFTYGPLGFLELPQVSHGLLATLSGVYLLALRAALAASLLWAARRSLPWAPALVLAVAAAAVVPRATASVPLALATLWCLVALHDAEAGPPWVRRTVVIGGGVLAGVEVLVKLNAGLTILIIVLVAAAALPGSRSRNLATTLVAFAATCASLWLLSGQGPANADDYLRSSVWVVSGYSEAMQLQAPEVSWDWAAALLAGAAAIAATGYAGRRMARGPRIASVVVTSVVVFSLWKFGFVRHDGGHAGAFFEGIVVVWVALLWRGRERWAALAAVAAIIGVYFAVAGPVADFSVHPGDGVRQLKTLLVPGEREEARDEARSAMQAQYGLDPRIVARIGDDSVDARPWEIGLLWAYDLDYEPLPVLQDYQAYDPRLDRLNRQALVADSAPAYILRHLGYGDSAVIGIDGRYTAFDSPQATLEMLCRYRPVLEAAPYELLERAGAGACGEPRPLGTVEAGFGEQVSVPRARPGEAVLVRIEGASAAGLERLRAFLYRAAERRIQLGRAVARFPARNASGPLLISMPRRVDLPAPFALAPNVETIAVETAGGFAAADGPLEFEFEALALEPTR